MSVQPSEKLKIFNILSIGQRGVGKTVFLAGSHIELQDRERFQKDYDRYLWFECENKESEDNLSQIVRYIEKNGEYPPPTMKITDFTFNLCWINSAKPQKLCTFIWSDIPGEICENNVSEFREMVYASQGCCVFIDIKALVDLDSYLAKLSGVMEQVAVIANLTKLNNLNYPFSIVMTKCDLISPEPASKERLERRLQELTKYLRNLGINYRVFFSFIPIDKTVEKAIVQPQGAAIALLWLVAEVEKSYQKAIARYASRLRQRENPEIFQGALQSVFDSSTTDRSSLLGSRRSILIPAAIASGLALAVASLVLTSNILPQKNTLQTEVEQRRIEESISGLEKLVQSEPNRWEWQLQLAELYQSNGNYLKAEQIYDHLIAEGKNPVTALVKKALIRQQQGDRQAAATLFMEAEKAAPNEEVKAQIRALAAKKP